ncbi:aluminum-activated malate transporter 2-like [Capsicum annuum]|uniref:aluminum-activated malate transporter 2-like n=1 Tax=Capsicum annuum TaxID=4072 RepID=UPI001FB125EE|nr:aluminum-activated malate transporter 2-like [Capsicum annuum]
MVISMVVHPVWAGEDLVKLVSVNLEKLANSLEGFGSEYFNDSGIKSVRGNKNNVEEFLKSLLSVLGSKANEESLVSKSNYKSTILISS